MSSPVRTVFGVAIAAAAMAAGWRFQHAEDIPDAAWHEPMGPMGPDMGGPPEPPFPLAPLTPGFALSLVVVAAGIVLLRRRPLAGFVLGVAGMVLYGALGGTSLGTFPAALVLSIGLVRRIGLSRTAPWLALLLLAIWSTWWDEPALGLTDWRTWWTSVTNFLWVLLPTLLVALAVGRRQAREREHADAIERAATEERLRLAREIHDVVGHSLSMISLQSGVALRVLDADPAQARASLEAIRSSSKDALADLRQTLGVFRGDEGTPLAPTPTVAAIAALVAEVRSGGVRVGLAPLPDAVGVGSATQAAAYRIVQEGLTNAVRHAPGAAVHVAVGRHGDGLTVRVADDGTPPPAFTEGGGLRGMRERTDALGGTLVAGPTASGFVIEATLPGGER